jgi:flagellar biosynthesis protein FlhB
MVKSLLLVWLVGVVAFFVLWALLASIIKRVSDKKNKNKTE